VFGPPLTWGLSLCLSAACDSSRSEGVQTARSPATSRVEAVAAPDSTPKPPLSATRPPPPEPEPGSSAADGSKPDLSGLSGPARADAEAFPGTRMRPPQLLRELRTAPMLSFRPVGSTSTVFRTLLKGLSFRAAFKAATFLRPFGAVAEVAAYRLSRCLGMINVPPAVLRRASTLQLQFGLEAGSPLQWVDIAPRLRTDPNGQVEGAAILWIDGLRELELSTAAGRDQLLATLNQSQPLPDPPPPMAAQLSELLAFDYLIGNWDRWSGSNVKGDADGQYLIVRDHDAAFAGLITETVQRRMLDLLVRNERFSRSFVQRLRALSRASFDRELGQDTSLAMRPHRGFSTQGMDGLFDRRGTLLSHVQALIEEYGEGKVLVFP
jgi:hypothetical protein